jgi:Ca2+-transporting ATPase
MWHAKGVDEVLAALGTGREGLSEDEAARRLQSDGPNELKKEEGTSPLGLFVNQFKNVLILILIVATALSLAVGETVDALIIGIIIIFSAALGFVQEYRAERALDALKKMLALEVTVLRDGEERELDSREIVRGDVLVLEAGDRIPADARVIESISLRCDEAPLTGESAPVGKTVAPVPAEASVPERRNTVYTGSVVTYGRARAVVTATAMATEFGKIAREVSAVRVEKTPLEKRTDEIGKWLGVVTLTVCVVVIGVSALREHLRGGLTFDSGLQMVMFGIALAVAAVPEALAAIVTGALAIGMREMAKKNALVRRMPAVETLGSTTVICTDKTGTLTKGEMTVRKVYLHDRMIEVGGAGYEPVGEFRGLPEGEVARTLDLLVRAGALCNDAGVRENGGRWTIKGDPTEAALVVLAGKRGIDPDGLRKSLPRRDEVPFSSERKLMTTLHDEDAGRVAYLKGAPEVILARATSVMAASGEVRPLSEEDRNRIRDVGAEMAGAALRVLGIGYRTLGPGEGTGDAEREIVFLGLAGMMDPPRPEAIEAVKVCKRVHMRPVMITGDHALTARAVAIEMGIFEEGDRELTGEELEAMSDREFESIVHTVSVYARVSPMDKLKIVNAWKKRGDIVAMTGDGVNDAPALKHADIGIAMGLSGTEVAKEAADIVLSDDNFATIVDAIERGRWIYDNIKKYLTYLLRCNITEVLVIGGVVLAMGPEFLPLLPAAILYVNLATDGLPALALGISPPDPDIMSRPPRNPKESVFSREVRVFILMAVVFEFPIFLYMFLSAVPDMELARTRMFFMFVFLELVIALNFRSLHYGMLKAPPHGWLLLALAWEAVLLVGLMAIPAVRESFGVGLPRVRDVLEIIGFGLSVVVAMEVVKAILRRRAAPHRAPHRA